jgi:hypothetical protein
VKWFNDIDPNDKPGCCICAAVVFLLTLLTVCITVFQIVRQLHPNGVP